MFTSSNHVEKKADNSTSIENIKSLQCLSEWIKNIESNEPDLIQLDFAKIKDDLVKNVKGNDTAMKLCYSKIWTYNDQDKQTKINKAYWNGYNSIIHFILDEEKSLLYPVSNPEIHKKQSKIQKLLQSNKSLSIICKQNILILKLLLLDTKIIKICELYEDGDTTEWSIYYHIVNLLHSMYCNEAYYQKYGITNIMELYFNFFVQCWSEKGDYEKYQDCIINIQEHPREQCISYSTINGTSGDHMLSFLPIKLIKKLLWKNISPVQFCEGCNWGFDDVITCYGVEQIKNDHRLSTKFENICRKIVDNTGKLKTNLAVTAPLIIMIYLNEIKVEMECILNECLLDLEGDLVSIIIEYLYFDIGSIYKIKNFENEFSVKCYHFLNYLNIINDDLIFNNNFDNTPASDGIEDIVMNNDNKVPSDIPPPIPQQISPQSQTQRPQSQPQPQRPQIPSNDHINSKNIHNHISENHNATNSNNRTTYHRTINNNNTSNDLSDEYKLELLSRLHNSDDNDNKTIEITEVKKK
eukprot:443161_1